MLHHFLPIAATQLSANYFHDESSHHAVTILCSCALWQEEILHLNGDSFHHLVQLFASLLQRRDKRDKAVLGRDEVDEAVDNENE